MDMIDQNLIATYRGATKEEICEWLTTHLPVSRLNKYESAGFDKKGRYRWRLAIGEHDRRVLFYRKEDFMLFSMVWS